MNPAASRPQRRRRQASIARKTESFNIATSSMVAVDLLVEREVFPNRSAAADAAFRLLIAYHADALHDALIAEPEAA